MFCFLSSLLPLVKSFNVAYEKTLNHLGLWKQQYYVSALGKTLGKNVLPCWMFYLLVRGG